MSGKKNRRKDDYWESEEALADAALAADPAAAKPAAAASPAPAESPQPAGGKKGGKGKAPADAAAKPAAPVAAEAPASAPADPKPAAPAAAAAEPAPSAPAADADADGDDGEEDGEEDAKASGKPSAPKSKDAAKKKKKPEAKKAAGKGAAARAALAARIQAEQAARKAEEEELKRLQEEERKREEEERKAEEEREKKAAEERERAKIAKKKRAAAAAIEAEKKAAEQRKRDALSKYSGSVAAAAQVQAQLDGTAAPAEAEDDKAEGAAEAKPAAEKQKRPIYEKKKSKKAGAHNTTLLPTSTPSSSAASSAAATPLSQSTAEPSPAATTPAAAAAAPAAAAPAEEADSWELALEEKPKPPAAAPAAEAKPAAAGAAPAAEAKPAAAEVKPAMPTNAGGKKGAKAAKEAKEAEKKEKEKAKNEEDEELRSPICCVLGHVDVGKTKLLDKIRRTNYQDAEAGGITQQIGATYFPLETLKEKTRLLSEKWKLEIKVPGLLVIDTPGHESFTNLRSRGSSLCDIAVLVVDLMHGLEPQTIQSIELLKKKKCPFVVALNKVDRLYGWKANPNSPFVASLKEQNKDVKAEFDMRVQETVNQFAAQGLNAVLYYQNKDFKSWVSLVPTSAHSGEGIPDLLMLLVQLTQRMMRSQLVLSEQLACTVLEVKVVEGHGTTIDVILYDGSLHEGEEIVVCGLNGPIVTTIRALLTPPPLKEIRFKSQYVHNKVCRAAQGIKIAAHDLEHAVAGSQLYVVRKPEDKEWAMKEVMKDLENVMKLHMEKGATGVYVQASTLGSLEALLEFLKESDIPVSAVSLGPVHKKDVIKASVMLERSPEHAVILAFDVKVTPEARHEAEHSGVRIFTAEIIYHLFDQFTKYMNDLRDQKKKEAVEAVFPCMMQVIPEYIFHVKDPIIVGIRILDGTLRMGTPVCVPSKEFIELGRVTSMEINHKAVDIAKKGDSVAVRLEGANPVREYGRHFDHTNLLYSKITLDSLDELNAHFKDELTKEDELLLKDMKKVFKSRLHIM